MRHAFQLVRYPMAKIEGAAAARLERVTRAADVPQMKNGRTLDEFFNRGGFATRESCRVVHQPRKEARIFDQRHFDGFCHASQRVAWCKSRKEAVVVEHRPGGSKRSKKILESQMVDAVFDTDPAIVLPQHGRGYTHQADAAVASRGCITHRVQHGAAAQGKHEAVTIQLALLHHLVELLDVLDVI